VHKGQPHPACQALCANNNSHAHGVQSSLQHVNQLPLLLPALDSLMLAPILGTEVPVLDNISCTPVIYHGTQVCKQAAPTTTLKRLRVPAPPLQLLAPP
jgi:hypothetical protein